MKTLNRLSLILIGILLASLSMQPVYSSGDHAGSHTDQSQNPTVDASTETGTEQHQDHIEKTTRDSNHDHPEKGLQEAENPAHTGEEDRSAHSEHPADSLFSTVFPGLSGASNVHPMVVHFPIVFVYTSLLFVFLSWKWKPTEFLSFARWTFWLSLVSFPVTAATGLLAVGGWGSGHVTGHRNLMLITVGLAFGLWIVLRFVSDRTYWYRLVLTLGLLIVTVFMTLGTDRGAWLVYVKGSGVQSGGHVHSSESH